MTESSFSKYQEVTKYIVDGEYENSRLDNCLISKLKNVPKSKIYSTIRKGEVRVNGSRSKPDRRLKKNDVIRIPPLKITEKKVFSPSKSLESLLKGRIIYNKDSILILDKPEGLASHGGSGLKLGLIEAIRQLDTKFKDAQLVHRLDRDTSGCIVLSLKRSVLRKLNLEMREGRVIKKYLAVVKGVWPKEEIQIKSKLKKNNLRSGEREVVESPEGKLSVTNFKLIKVNKHISFLECSLLTGRTHQIRVQASKEGHPVIGDKKYGDKDINEIYKKKGIRRMMLHASEISFPKLNIRCNANVPSLFNKMINES